VEIKENTVKIVNLTQHVGTPEQGVIEPVNKKEVQDLLTFDTLESTAGAEIVRRAIKLAEIAQNAEADAAMLGGAPFLMSTLERILLYEKGIQPLYSFSLRQSVDKEIDGKIQKISFFKHIGWTKACPG
jgi:hypothetical protein